MRIALLLALCAGCGRIGFSAREMTDDATPPIDDTGAGLAIFVGATPPGYVSAPSMTVNITQAAGELLVAAVYWNTAAATVNVTDTMLQTWASTTRFAIASGCGAPTGGAVAQLFYTTAVGSGANSITATQSSTSNPLAILVLQYRGAGMLDVAGGAVAPAASNSMATNVLDTQYRSLLVGVFHNSLGTGAMTPGTGYTARGIDTESYAIVLDNVPGDVAGSYSLTGQLPAGRNDACWVGAAAAFRLE